MPQPPQSAELNTELRAIGDRLLAIALEQNAAPASSANSAAISALTLLGLSADLRECIPQQQVSPFQVLTARSGFNHFPQPALLGDYGVAHFADPASHYAAFVKEAEALPNNLAGFESYCQLYRQYATYVAAPLAGKAALPLYELFHSLTALGFALAAQPDTDKLLLIGGDLPGIQNMLYTIGSGGAAKALRGRSFYLSLLTDMVMRYLLHELDLPTASLLFNAGGNFLLLAPSIANFESVRRDINARLLDLHHGELYVSLACQELPLDGDFAGNFKSVRKNLGSELAAQKLRQFKEQAQDNGAAQLYRQMFAPQGSGGSGISARSQSDTDPIRTFCPVCHVDFKDQEVRRSEQMYAATRNNPDDYKPRCRQCASFELRIYDHEEPLAEQLKDANYMRVTAGPPPADLKSIWDTTIYSKPAWYEVAYTFGVSYEFASRREQLKESGGYVYSLNKADFLPQQLHSDTSYGFRYLANGTPVYTSDYTDEEGRGHKKGDIRDTRDMAAASLGIPRYGVLRMDVDGLGSLFGAEQLDMPALCAASAALSLYFEGWLGRIAQDVAEAGAEERARRRKPEDKSVPLTAEELLPYIIYAGGDDLFVVASWDLLPLLADRVRSDLADYVRRGYLDEHTRENWESANKARGKLPLLTISGGLSVVDEKFPLYQAAADAHDALEEAKNLPRRYDGNSIKKHAFCLFGQAIGWEEYPDVTKMKDWIVSVVGSGGSARSLLRRLNTVNALYRQVEAIQARRMRQPNVTIDQLDEETFYSRWQWRLVYSLRQFAAGEVLAILTNKDNRNAIGQLGLATRWAEFVTRPATNKQGGDSNGR